MYAKNCLEEFKFRHPFTAIVCGMTSSGKTEFTSRLLKNWKQLIKIDTSFLNVLWCYSESESVKNISISNTRVNYFKGIPNSDDLKTYSPQIIVLDDLMGDINKDIKDLFTKLSHHKNISIILIVQNSFNQNKFMRDISLNTLF